MAFNSEHDKNIHYADSFNEGSEWNRNKASQNQLNETTTWSSSWDQSYNQSRNNRNSNNRRRRVTTMDDIIPIRRRTTPKQTQSTAVAVEPAQNTATPVEPSSTPVPVETTPNDNIAQSFDNTEPAQEIKVTTPELENAHKSTPVRRQNRHSRGVAFDDIIPVRRTTPRTRTKSDETENKWVRYANENKHSDQNTVDNFPIANETVGTQSLETVSTESQNLSSGLAQSIYAPQNKGRISRTPSITKDNELKTGQNNWSQYVLKETQLYEENQNKAETLEDEKKTSSTPEEVSCATKPVSKDGFVSAWAQFATDKNEDPPLDENTTYNHYPGTNASKHCPSNHGISDTSKNWRVKTETPRFSHSPENSHSTETRRPSNGGASSNWRKITDRNETNQPQPPAFVHLEDRNRFNKREFFNPYLSQSDMEKGIEEGKYYQGILRITKNRSDAYVVSDDLDFDIYVGGSIDRNRALSGDLVAVELLDVEDVWAMRKERQLKRQEDKKRFESEHKIGSEDDPGTESSKESEAHEVVEDDEEENKPKYCGRIVGIVSRSLNHTFAGTICIERTPNRSKDDQENKKQTKDLRIAWFKPSDKRVPFIILRNQDIPKDLVENEEYYETHLFAVKLIRWQITDLNPTGRIIKELGPIGDLDAERIAILADNNIIDAGFSSQALQCLPEVPWTIPEAEYRTRRDLRSSRVFSIDPSTAKDLDDALHVKELEDGFFEVGVHIADVSYFLKRNSVLDSEARERGTSTYLVDSVIPMLPSLLCEELCSLNPGVERLSFSVIWKMDKFGKPVSTWFGRTIIKSCAKLAYEDAQAVIDGHPFRSDIEIHNDEDPFYIYSDIRRLHKLSVQMRKRRYENGCLSLNSVKLNFKLNEQGEPVEVSKFEAKEANRLIEEFMLFANINVAQKICEAFPNESLLRRHQEPVKRRLDEFIKITDVLGLYFNGNSAGELQQSFNGIKNETVKDVLLVLAIRCMQKAKYFCSGTLDISKFAHYALSESLYTHFTSPIRRYADVIVHRLLEAALEYEQHPEKQKVPPYNKKVVQKIALDCNGKKDGAKNAQDESSLLHLAKYLAKQEEENGPVYMKATVIVVGKQVYDVYLPEYGLEKRIHLDMLPVESYVFDKNTLSLDIYWKRGVPVTMHNEEKIYAQQRVRVDDYSDDEEEEIEFKEPEVEDSLAALSLQEPAEYNRTVNPDDLIPPVMLDENTCKQTIKMFSVIDVRIQVNMERSPPFINVYPVNPF